METAGSSSQKSLATSQLLLSGASASVFHMQGPSMSTEQKWENPSSLKRGITLDRELSPSLRENILQYFRAASQLSPAIQLPYDSQIFKVITVDLMQPFCMF